METKKLKLDVIKTQVEIFHKKILVFLGVGAGSFYYAVKFIGNSEILVTLFALFLALVFAYVSLGTIVTLVKLNSLEKDLDILKRSLDE
jgi:hypothetical protein